MDGKRNDWTLPALLAGLTALFHLLTAADSYGLFRDELYYLACGSHLGFGYVDQPPLIGWIAWFARGVLGDSMLAVRALPALAAGGTVFIVTQMCRELGGGRPAQALAAAATALAPVYVGNFGFLSMNAFDVLFWAAAVWILMRLLRTGDARYWIPFGLVAGLGLENKISVLFLGFGVAVGLLLDRRWEQLRSPKLWLGGVIAFGLFLPHLIWQAVNGWPTLEFMRNATQYKNVPLAPLDFLSAQVLMMNPLALPLALTGLAFFLFSKKGRPWRSLGFAFLAVVVLLITQRSKPYYLSPAYTMLFAPGAVVVAGLASRPALRWLPPVAMVVVVATGALLAPLAKPILSVERYVSYAERLGVAPSTDERKEVGRLPQFFADRLGWSELAETVAAVHGRLPRQDRERACIFGQNYGQAGAIDFYGKALGLPRALAGHNSYHLWGPGDCSGEVVIVIGDQRDDLEQLCEQVELGATFTCDDCMPYENNKPIWVCRQLRVPPGQLWAEIGHYD